LSSRGDQRGGGGAGRDAAQFSDAGTAQDVPKAREALEEAAVLEGAGGVEGRSSLIKDLGMKVEEAPDADDEEVFRGLASDYSSLSLLRTGKAAAAKILPRECLPSSAMFGWRCQPCKRAL